MQTNGQKLIRKKSHQKIALPHTYIHPQYPLNSRTQVPSLHTPSSPPPYKQICGFVNVWMRFCIMSTNLYIYYGKRLLQVTKEQLKLCKGTGIILHSEWAV